MIKSGDLQEKKLYSHQLSKIVKDIDSLMTEMTTTSPVNQLSQSKMPYTKSWVDHLIQRIDRIQGPSWVFYIVALVVLVFTNNAIFWLDGSQALGSHNPVRTADSVFILIFLALYHHLSIVVIQSFDVFKTVLKLPETELKIIEYRLTTLPRWLEWLAIFIAIIISIQSIQSDPASFGLDTARTFIPFVYQYIVMIFTVTTLIVLIFQIVRQLKLVTTLHKQAVEIDIFQLTPFHAFAKFTARAGIGLLAFVIYNNIFDLFLNSAGAPLYVVVVVSVLAVSVFVIPLLGIQSRLEDEKERRLNQTNEMIKLTLDKIHAQVNSDKYEKIPELNTTMTALLAERNLVKQISTWPWETSTLSGFVSTVLIPFFLWFVTRLLENLI